MSFDAVNPTSKEFRDAIAERLESAAQQADKDLLSLHKSCDQLVQAAARYYQGGKRLRPAFVYWGYSAFAGQPEDADAILRAGAGFEMLHAGILVHDDLIDNSPTRRGEPSAHKHFGEQASEEFGRQSAVVLGDMMLGLANDLVYCSGLERLSDALPYWRLVQNEVNAGQFLDVSNQFGLLSQMSARDAADLVLEAKTSRYTVMRPLQFGAAAGGANEQELAKLGDFGSALGRAFQLRDDLLGIFGDEGVTGKATGGDLVEGKQTVLLGITMSKSEHAEELAGLIGREMSADELERALNIIMECGALDDVGELIGEYVEKAYDALDKVGLNAESRDPLAQLLVQCVDREK